MAITKFSGEYEFLSNFYPVTILVEGQKFPSAEHAYQACKSSDKDVRFAVSLSRSPKEAKRAGQTIELRDDWEQVKVETMYNVLEAKFKQHADLAEKLKATGEEELIEGNTWRDSFWGIYKGEGENMLGKLLMKIRKELMD